MTDPGLASQVYTIAQVTERTGVSADTLRSWERRHGFPHPHRSGNAYREYTNADIAAIQAFQEARSRGRSVPQALREVQSPLLVPPRVASSSSDADVQVSKFVAELATMHFGEAEIILRERIWVSPLESIAFDLLVPAHEEVFRQRVAGALSIACAQFASAWINRKLASALDVTGPDQGSRLVTVVGFGERLAPVGFASAIALSSSGLRVVVADNVQAVGEIVDICTRSAASGIIAVGASRSIDGLHEPIKIALQPYGIEYLALSNEENDSARQKVQGFLDRIQRGEQSG